MKHTLIDMTGMKFHSLTVLSVDHSRTVRGRTFWFTLCECGKQLSVSRDKLISNRKKSCGCKTDNIGEFQTIHGMSNTVEYRAWRRIKTYCLNPKSEHFMHYGGRGITICKEWENSFETFLKDVGKRPTSKHSIDRIDVDGNYEKSNVRWATQSEQMRNTRKTIFATISGCKMPLLDWCNILGHDKRKIYSRIFKQKMTPEEALLKL